jgi:hypothetical protein
MNAPKTTPVEIEELRAKLDPTKVGLLCILSPRRIGALSFIVFLEHRHFPPGTPENEHFNVVLMPWEGMRFALVVIHKRHLPVADELARTLGLRRANGVPTLIGENARLAALGTTRPEDRRDEKRFPLDLPNVFTMENIRGHFAYANDLATAKTAYDFEDEAIAREMESFKATQPHHARPNPTHRE